LQAAEVYSDAQHADGAHYQYRHGAYTVRNDARNTHAKRLPQKKA
jgi:hypothetical protein